MRDYNSNADIVEEQFIKTGELFTKKYVNGDVLFTLVLTGKNMDFLDIQLKIDPNDECRYKCILGEDLPQEKWVPAIMECNRINTESQYVNFCLDEEGCLYSTYDFSLFGYDEKIIPARVVAILAMCTRITDYYINRIVDALWNNKE